MKRTVVVASILAAMAAYGNEHAESAEHGEGKGHDDPASFILHHVTDTQEFEFDVPLVKGAHGPKISFPTWRIPLKAGACPADVHESASLMAGCLDVSLTKNVLMLWIASVILLLTFILGSHRDATKLVPRGTSANLLEMLVLFVRNEIAVKNIGEKHASRYTPFLLSIFFFILFVNLLGLIPFMSTATGALGVTTALALCTFFVTQSAAIRSAGIGGYLKHLTGGVPWPLWPIMIPVEVLGLFTKPFALTVRLFANMLAGHLVLFFLLGLIFFIGTVFVAPLAVAMGVFIYVLELFVAFVQAFVFTMLSAVFIGMGVATGHHDEAHGHEEHAHG